jgi:hypothetical protein
MRLTRKKAIELCIELWTWLAKTGAKRKDDWPKWEEYEKSSDEYILNSCWFCEYNERQKNRYNIDIEDDCRYCPWDKIFGVNNESAYGCQEAENSPYDDWRWAKTTESRKKYAKLFLAQIKKLK